VRVRAVTLHDVEPETFEQSVRIRDWLTELGVERATLLVIPASRLHRFDYRSPDLADWLRERAAAGDAVAQHGLQHHRTRHPGSARDVVARWQGGSAAEFPGLDPYATVAAVRAGRAILAGAGIEPRGFVAPGFAYTRALRREVGADFDWWAGSVRVHRRGGRGMTATAHTLGTSTRIKRALSPLTMRLGSPRARLLRVEVHPHDFEHERHVRALERLLRASAGRPDVTYDQLLAG
jgi:predicted deacetylase